MGAESGDVNLLADVLEWFGEPAHWSGEQGLVNRFSEHALLSLTSVAVALVLALPFALWLGHLGRGGVLAVNVSNVGRAVPTFAVLVLLSIGPLGTGYLGPYGRAGLATLVALVLFALPPIVTNAYVGMRQVDSDVVAAAKGMGMSDWRLFWTVERPLAMPLIMAGIRLAAVQVWATATIAALVAGPGLGNIITAGFDNQDLPQTVSGGLVVAAGALLVETLLGSVQRRSDPVRRAARADAGTPANAAAR